MRYQNTYAQLDTRLYNEQLPNPLDNPRVGHFNNQVAEQLGWTEDVDLMALWVDIVGGHDLPAEF